MGSLLWLVVGLLSARRSATYAGGAGPERLRDLDDVEVRALADHVTGRALALTLWGGLASCGLGVVVSAITLDLLPLLGWVLATAALAAATALWRRTAPTIVSELEARDPASPARPDARAETRSRRLRLAAGVAVVGFCVGQVLELAGEQAGQRATTAAGSAVLLVAFLALAVVAWSTVWLPGDARAPRRR